MPKRPLHHGDGACSAPPPCFGDGACSAPPPSHQPLHHQFLESSWQKFGESFPWGATPLKKEESRNLGQPWWWCLSGPSTIGDGACSAPPPCFGDGACSAPPPSHQPLHHQFLESSWQKFGESFPWGATPLKKEESRNLGQPWWWCLSGPSTIGDGACSAPPPCFGDGACSAPPPSHQPLHHQCPPPPKK